MAEASDPDNENPKNKNPPLVVLQRAKRMPKRLWNTPEAQVRRLKLQAETQRRYGARKKAEQRILRNRQRQDSSSSSDDGMSGIVELQSSSSEGEDDVPSLQRQYPTEGILAAAQQHEVQLHYNGNTDVPHQLDFRDGEEDDLAIIAKKFAQVKVGSNVSDGAIEKLFKMFCEEKDRISRLLQQRRITRSYRKSIKPQALKCIPTVFCSYNIQETTTEGQIMLYKTTDMREIPTRYLNIPPTSNQKLLRMESYVRLVDIKRSFIKNHGTDNLKEHLANCHVSVDGVKESAKGRRTFIIVTLRIHNCLYLYRVFNPLIGNQASKPSPVELLR